MTSAYNHKSDPWSKTTTSVSGFVSVAVLIYAISIHSLLIVDATTQSHRLSQLMTPTFGIVHGAICISGAVLAIIFIIHICRNPMLTPRRRLLWSVASASGYGLLFYWYHHILNRDVKNSAS
jgi:hypothetical protein